MQTKWLIVGGSGQLGANFVASRTDDEQLVATFCRHPLRLAGSEWRGLDLTEAAAARLIREERPQVVLFAAAQTEVDRCETHPKEAQQVNALGPRSVAQCCHEMGARFIHISTDSVFDGEGPFSEEDRPSPVNAYARSKVEGEQMVLEAHPEALVLRLNIFGWSPGSKPSYAEWLLRHFRGGQSCPVLSDVQFNPLLATTICAVIRELARTRAAGILHLGNADPCTKLEFARRLGTAFGIDADRHIRPTPLAELKLVARRPRDTRLDARRAEALLGRPLPGLDEELARLRLLEHEGFSEALRSQAAAI